MKTILIVDDESDVLSSLKTIFTSEQYQVLTAPNGRAALLVIAKQRPDLLLTDWMMPDMDGPELCRQVRSDPALAALPIILMSGSLLAPAGVAAWNRFLNKPIDIDALLSLVKVKLQH